MKCCESCSSLWFFSGDITQPYPEFCCTKGHWDAIENPDTLLDIIDCNDYTLKT